MYIVLAYVTVLASGQARTTSLDRAAEVCVEWATNPIRRGRLSSGAARDHPNIYLLGRLAASVIRTYEYNV